MPFTTTSTALGMKKRTIARDKFQVVLLCCRCCQALFTHFVFPVFLL
jgi:hypothetical protein